VKTIHYVNCALWLANAIAWGYTGSKLMAVASLLASAYACYRGRTADPWDAR
jgi:hypothetical protein